MIDALYTSAVALGVLPLRPLHFAVAALCAAAAAASQQVDSRRARRIAIVGAGVSLALTALGEGFSFPLLGLSVTGAVGNEDGRWARVFPVMVSATGVIAVTLTPIVASSPKAFARMLAVVAASLLLALSTHPLVLVFGWFMSAMFVWLELRAATETAGAARGFLAYLLPSCLLVLTGAVLQLEGRGEAAVVPLVLGLSLREAMVPFHSWFPRFVESAPLGMVVVFAAPQLGVFAHVRWLSDGPELAHIIAAAGVVTVLFAAALGVIQTNARRALGYLLISQTALVAFGLETDSAVGHTGALLSWLVVGLASAGLVMVTAALEARRGPLSLDQARGNFRQVPLLASTFLLLGLASVGLPGTLGFIAEDLLVEGSVDTFPFLGLALIAGTALNSITVLRSYFALFTGTRTHQGERDLVGREKWALSAILAALFFTGLYPRAVVGDHHVLKAHREGAADAANISSVSRR